MLDAEAVSAAMVALRPRLHRYCARMMGSMLDGEDVVQEALARAAEALPRAGVIEKPEGWLFRIAHTTAIDALRKRKRGIEVSAEFDTDAIDTSAEADARVAAAASLSAFMHLTPIPRASVLIVDVLGFSQAECVELLGVTLPTVKAALARGRVRLAEAANDEAPEPQFDAAERGRLRAYADAFNARDFDGLRALLADDVSLDLVNRLRLRGRADVAVYFARYADTSITWQLEVGEMDGRLALLARNVADLPGPPHHAIFLDWRGEAISGIRDFIYGTYAMA